MEDANFSIVLLNIGCFMCFLLSQFSCLGLPLKIPKTICCKTRWIETLNGCRLSQHIKLLDVLLGSNISLYSLLATLALLGFKQPSKTGFQQAMWCCSKLLLFIIHALRPLGSFSCNPFVSLHQQTLALMLQLGGLQHLICSVATARH